MEKWKCNYCNGYISVNVDMIEFFDKVDFKIFEDIGGLYLKYIPGHVLFKDNDMVYISCDFGLYRVHKNNIYPKNAPVKFIYNMFWTCLCGAR